MSVRNQGWHNLNESRAFPFDDAATLLDDSALRTPMNILSGLKVFVPASAGKFVYVGALSVSPAIVTVILLATDDLDAAGVPVLSLSRRKPVTRHQPYQLTSHYAGAAGWLTLGGGVATPYQGRFSSPRQSLLAPTAARSYLDSPIASVGKFGTAGLTGLVRLSGGNDIEIVQECREIPGHALPSGHPQRCGAASRQVVVFRLKDTSEDRSRNVFEEYRGPCGNRPESGNCPDPAPAEFLNAVSPDCCGNITIEFRGCAEVSQIVSTTTAAQACGAVINCGLDFTEACVSKDRLPAADGTLPNEYEDMCAPPPAEPAPLAELQNPTELLTLSVGGQPVATFVGLTGDFRPLADGTLGVISGVSRSIALCQTALAVGPYCRVDGLAVLDEGSVSARRNAMVLANYVSRPDSEGSYYALEIEWSGRDVKDRLVKLLAHAPGSSLVLSSQVFPEMALETPYALSLEVHDFGGLEIYLAGRISRPDGEVLLDLPAVRVRHRLPPSAVCGLGARQSRSRFQGFAVSNQSREEV